MKSLTAFAFLIAVSATLAASVATAQHVVEINRPVTLPEDGLLLGNGDLSVSIYQATDQIIWRFGKNDVWDRRVDRSDDPKPAHIDEVAHGIEVEGWKCPPYGGPVEATRGTNNPARMKEICQAVPPSYDKFPSPTPKPVGELSLHFTPDLPGLEMRQRLLIEQGKATIDCTWATGVALHVECFVGAKTNALAVRWKLDNWNVHTGIGLPNGAIPPVWISLRRWADPTRQAFGEAYRAASLSTVFVDYANSPKATPLTPPTVKQDGALWSIEQTFAADPTFPNGFSYLMTPFVPAGVAVSPIPMAASGEARLHMIPTQEAAHAGQLVVAIATTSDRDGPAAEVKRIAEKLGDKLPDTVVAWEAEALQAAAEFWARAKVSIADPVLENLWYETLHARRCAYRRGITPPGLFLPSTVNDYNWWHGDYHWNYNFQEPFWGDLTANQLEVADSYFDALQRALHIGRKIAKDYYNCRGAFIQLSTYPFVMEDDPLGCCPMGRMAYVTGWAINQCWWRYLYTLDKEWLRAEGYPAIRDCALFYTDFMKKRDDGLYHIFPSNQGEDGFTGNPKEYTDRPQIMHHMRYCLRAAILASEALGTDEDLRAEWRERLDHIAGDDGKPPVVLAGLEKLRSECNPPEFSPIATFHHEPLTTGSRWDSQLGWYYGKYPWQTMLELRTASWNGDRDYPGFRRTVEMWRRPNGLRNAMAVANYGHAGAWTESLGITAPLQEMMLQSWDGALKIFPAWPKQVDASFENLRAEGAFLVAATWAKGAVASMAVRSEKGSLCRIYSPWPTGFQVTDAAGQQIAVTADPYDRPEFATSPGMTYQVKPR